MSILEKFPDGKELNVLDVEAISESEWQEICDNQITFMTKLEYVEELHLYDITGFEIPLEGWPVIYIHQNGKRIVLESAFGNQNESQLICAKAIVSHEHVQKE